ncbi:MAG: MFS transporter [Thermoleophilia bacterium]|nr:MFS transporter [Thermoleophilia bacterium]MDH3725766.1 MFS transporter [Thermoleophilia bacterium]
MTRPAWAAWLALLIFTMGTSIVTPLFPLYQERFALTNGEITLLFAVYSLMVVPTMLIFGNASDRLGRKRVILPALASITAASLLLSFADQVPLLFLGRILQGLAVGGMLGVGTAFVVDHAHAAARERAAALAGLGFRLGFGLGPGIAGLVAQYSADPIHRPFQLHVVAMLIAVAAVVLSPETISRGTPAGRFSVGVPHGQLAAFATFLAPAVFMMSFLDATLLSVVPLYMADTLGVTNVALIGLVGFLVLGMGGLTPVLLAHLEPRRAVMMGVASAASASILVVAAAGFDSVALVIVAAGVIGLLNGLILQGCTAICGVSVPLNERGRLISALYMCAYSGTVPTIALGYLSQLIGLTGALAVASLAALAIATLVLTLGRSLYPRVIRYSPA